jgi:hypothetical protein
MSNLKSGEVSWTDASLDSNKKTGGKDSFLRLSPGSNIVRLLTLPHQYHQHKYVIPGGKKFGYSINCSGTADCPVCVKSGEKPKRRWFLGVVDRKTNTYKTLDIGFAVFKAIQVLAKDSDWGPPSNYDVDVVVDPNGGSTGYYTVVAKPPKPLSAADLVIQEENGTENLVRLATPPSVEKINEKLAKIMEEITASGHVEEETRSSDKEEDVPFKNYDQQKKNPF